MPSDVVTSPAAPACLCVTAATLIGMGSCQRDSGGYLRSSPLAAAPGTAPTIVEEKHVQCATATQVQRNGPHEESPTETGDRRREQVVSFVGPRRNGISGALRGCTLFRRRWHGGHVQWRPAIDHRCPPLVQLQSFDSAGILAALPRHHTPETSYCNLPPCRPPWTRQETQHSPKPPQHFANEVAQIKEIETEVSTAARMACEAALTRFDRWLGPRRTRRRRSIWVLHVFPGRHRHRRSYCGRSIEGEACKAKKRAAHAQRWRRRRRW